MKCFVFTFISKPDDENCNNKKKKNNNNNSTAQQKNIAATATQAFDTIKSQ